MCVSKLAVVFLFVCINLFIILLPYSAKSETALDEGTMNKIRVANEWLVNTLSPKPELMQTLKGADGANEITEQLNPKFWIGMTFTPPSSRFLFSSFWQEFGMSDLGQIGEYRTINIAKGTKIECGNGPAKGGTWYGYFTGQSTRCEFRFDPSTLKLLAENCYNTPKDSPDAKEQLAVEIAYIYDSTNTSPTHITLKKYGDDGSILMRFEIETATFNGRLYAKHSEYYFEGKFSSVYELNPV